MNDREFRNRLNHALPDAPEIFHNAMTDTLKAIVREDGKRRAASARKLRRTLLIAALVTLLLASAAVAAYHWKLFDAVWFFNTPPPAKRLPGSPICLRGRSTAWRLPSTRLSMMVAPST